jgi:SNF2 family DNA or RNA helicase
LIETLPESLIQPYQYRLADFFYDHPNCAGWVDMGLGKTVAYLMALQRLIDDFEVAHTLIIGPLRVARKVWTDEIDVWEHIRPFETQKILGTARQREKAMRTPAEIHLINRENVTWLLEQHFTRLPWIEYDKGDPRRNMPVKQTRKWHWDNVVIDESNSFSYQSSSRWKALRFIRKRIDRMTQLTGTPDTRNLMGLWAQIHLLDQGKRLGASEKSFKEDFFIPPSRYDPSNKYIPKHFAQKQIRKRLRDIVLTLRAKDYLDIEDPWPVWHRVDLTKAQRDVYEEMERNFIIQYGNNIITAVNAGVLANKLLQLANGFIYDAEKNWHGFHERKTEVLLDLVEAATGPIIVAYNYIPDRLRIEAALTKAKVNWRLLKTEQDEEDFKAGKIDVLILSPQSAGHGLNIHQSGARAIVWYGLVWSLEQYIQTNARLTGGHRAVGRQITLHHIVTEDTYEDRVRFTLNRNARNQEEMMDGLRTFVRSKS